MSRHRRPTPTGRAVALVNRLSGYALSMLLLAVASLVVIPEMIRADGQQAWGSIALGQALGAIGAVALAYGWQLSGPAIVATSDDAGRRREFEESLVLKGLLVVPITALCAGAALAFAHTRPDLAALGAASTACVGLTASWFFVGRAQPYHLLVAETLPRVGGTVLGIVLMRQGAGASAGLLCQVGGMIAGAAVSSLIILAALPRRPAEVVLRGPLDTLRRQRHGLGATVVSVAYVAAPLVIVSLVNPQIQSVYALVDKLQKQISVGLGPAVSVLQGWVPMGGADQRTARIRRALGATTAASLVLVPVMTGIGPFAIDWVGNGQIDVAWVVYLLMGVLIGIALFETAVAHAFLPTLGRLDVVARATWISALVGLPLIALGALVSVPMTMVGLLAGLACRTVLEVAVVARPARWAIPPAIPNPTSVGGT